MSYRINEEAVADEVHRFTAPSRYYWNRAIREIARDPFPRAGHFTERVIPIAPEPTRRVDYTIHAETSVSGETFYVLTGGFIPYSILFTRRDFDADGVRETGFSGEVGVFYIRPFRRPLA